MKLPIFAFAYISIYTKEEFDNTKFIGTLCFDFSENLITFKMLPLENNVVGLVTPKLEGKSLLSNEAEDGLAAIGHECLNLLRKSGIKYKRGDNFKIDLHSKSLSTFNPITLEEILIDLPL